MPELPEGLKKKLGAELNKILKKRKNNLNDQDIESIRLSFLNFFVALFGKYGQFLPPKSMSSGAAREGSFNYHKFVE